MNYEWSKDTMGRWETFDRDVGMSWIDHDNPPMVFLDGYFTTATLRAIADDVDALHPPEEATP